MPRSKSLGQIAWEARWPGDTQFNELRRGTQEAWEDAAQAVAAALPPCAPAPSWELVESLRNAILLAKNVCCAIRDGSAKSFPLTPDQYESKLDAALAEIAKARGRG